MEEKGIEDFSRVGLYGLTYKEDVDDTRESPTLQLLDVLRHKHTDPMPVVYDPFIGTDMVENQVHDLTEFLEKTELVVVMVGHSEIKDQPERLKDKAVLDTRNVISAEDTYRL